MARTAITPQKGTAVGSTVTFEAANVDGNSFLPARGRALHVRNGSGSSITVTVPTPATSDGLAVGDRTISVAAGAVGVFAPGAASLAGLYGQSATDSTIHVNYSAVTTVTVAVIDHP